jgi:hypothetical protein
MNEEALKILKMIEDGKISAEEGKKLLEALNDAPEEAEKPLKSAAPEKKNRILRVVVDTRGQGEEDARVRVNVPLDVARKLAKFTAIIPKDAKEEMRDNGIDIDSIDIEGLIEMFLNGEIDENLVDVETGNNGKGASVKVYVD